MTLAQLNCTEVSSIDTAFKNNVLRFEDRIKCLNSVFWNIHQNIENKERTLLIIDQKDDLEYINYFLSKYKLKPLTIIINPYKDYVSQAILAKFNKNLELDITNEKKENINSSIAFLSKAIQNHINQLRTPKLGKLNILEIFERKKITPLIKQKLNIDFYQLVPFNEFKAKKALVKKAFDLYKPEFQFAQKNNILKDAFILNLSTKDIKSVFDDIQEELGILHESIIKINNQIENGIEKTHLKQSNNLHRFFFEISKFKGIHELTSTEVKKFNHLCDKFDSKSIVKTSHLPYPERIVLIEETYQSHVRKLSAEKKKFGQYTLQRINEYNGGEKTLDIFKKLQIISKKILKTHAFKDFDTQRPCSLFACNQICEDLIYKLDYAEYFIENSKEYLKWTYFKNALKSEERTIIDALTKVKSNWVEVFESNYLDGFLESEIIDLFDIEPSTDELVGKLIEYSKQVAAQIHENHKPQSSVKLIPNAEGNETKIGWTEFFDEFGSKFSNKYPIVILDKQSYKKHAAVLQTVTDKAIFLNHNPDTIPKQAWNKNIFAGYENQFIRNIVSQTKAYDDVAVKNYAGVEFNVNRSINHLNNSERNMLALFLGQSMHKMNSEYRIFQLKSKSIISFLKDDKNAQLLQSLRGYGCKEIFSQEENNNLLPGIIADPNAEPIILIEDNLLSYDSKAFDMRQLIVLNKIKESGIKVISVNNYKLLTQKAYTLDNLISKVLNKGEIISNPVTV